MFRLRLGIVDIVPLQTAAAESHED